MPLKVCHLPLLLLLNMLCQEWRLHLERLDIWLHLTRICLDFLDLNDEGEKKVKQIKFYHVTGPSIASISNTAQGLPPFSLAASQYALSRMASTSQNPGYPASSFKNLSEFPGSK